MSESLRVVFMGSAELACPALQQLHDEDSTIIAGVVSQPDKPRGRKLQPHPTPLAALARDLGHAPLTPERARNPEFIDSLKKLEPDLIVVAAYGQILPVDILNLPAHGCLNVHASILPRYRGAAPIQWAIANGDAETGVTIMKMDEGLDTGDILAIEKTPIQDSDTGQTVHDRLARMGSSLLIRILPDYLSGKLKPVPQPEEGASYARKIKREDGRIDWSRSAHEIWNRCRAFDPWPGAFTRLHSDRGDLLLKLWKTEPLKETPEGEPGEVIEAAQEQIVVACGKGSLKITELQLEGKRRMTATEFLAGHALPLKTQLQ